MRFSRAFGLIFQGSSPAADDATDNFQAALQPDQTLQPQEASQIPDPKAGESMPKLINIGCGYDKRSGYLNVDMDPACDPDFLMTGDNATDLPADYFTKVLAKDVLEHIPRTQTLSALLQWSQYLQLGGRLELQTSSMYGVVDMMRAKEEFAYHYGMTVCMFGSQAHPGDFHYTGFTEKTLAVHLLAAGFMPFSIELEDSWLFNVKAIKIETWSDEPTQSDKLEALYNKALGRAADEQARMAFHNTPYLDAARSVYSSEERLYYTAARHGL